MPNDIDASNSTLKPSADWSDIELDSAVAAYLSMLGDELEGRPYIKAEMNRQLRAGALRSRTKASIEFRMQNISATLADLGMPHIAGYLPAKNVGNSVKKRIQSALEKHGLASLPFTPTADSKLFESRVSILRRRQVAPPPPRVEQPRKLTTSISTYVRDPAIKAWVLRQAAGVCEGCKSVGPFIDTDGFPFLEVHHVRFLADGGTDQTSNAVALCPNCHRRCHLSHDRSAFTDMLWSSIPRLIAEPDLGDGTLADDDLAVKI